MSRHLKYDTIRQCTPELVRAVQYDLGPLSSELLAAGLISEDNNATLYNKHHDEPDRAAKLVSFVRNKVELSPCNYDKFIEVLKEREAEHSTILKILDYTYKELSSAAEEKIKEELNCSSHPAFVHTQSLPASMSEGATSHVDRPRSMSTPDGSGYIPWFLERGMNSPHDHQVLQEEGISHQCLSDLREKNIADICCRLSTGGKVRFKQLCSEAGTNLQAINESPSNEARVCTVLKVTTSPCQSMSTGVPCAGNGSGRCIELDQRLDMSHHYMVSEYLTELPDETIRTLGGALGLSYPKLQRMQSLPGDMVAAWIRREDGVISYGEPTLRNLATALEKPGITQTGVAALIRGSRR